MSSKGAGKPLGLLHTHKSTACQSLHRETPYCAYSISTAAPLIQQPTAIQRPLSPNPSALKLSSSQRERSTSVTLSTKRGHRNHRAMSTVLWPVREKAIRSTGWEWRVCWDVEDVRLSRKRRDSRAESSWQGVSTWWTLQLPREGPDRAALPGAAGYCVQGRWCAGGGVLKDEVCRRRDDGVLEEGCWRTGHWKSCAGRSWWPANSERNLLQHPSNGCCTASPCIS